MYFFGSISLIRCALAVFTAVVLGGCTSTSVKMLEPRIGTQLDAASVGTDPTARILFATDRATNQEGGSGASASVEYGAERHAALGYGVVTLSVNPSVSHSKRLINPQVLDRMEVGRFPASPYPFSVKGGDIVFDDDVFGDVENHRKAFRNLVRTRLAETDAKELVMLVHGFNNGFDVAASTLASIWHHSGRYGVPLLYSWPASHGGLRGYFIDRESGEFTIFHLKETLRNLFEIEELEGIHIIAHSRGTDVITTSMRELLIEYRAAGRNPAEAFRIRNLVLAAPDLDFGIIRQRLLAEAFGSAFGRITVYTTASDKALGLSQILMKGIRFGLLGSGDVGVRERRIFKSVGNVDFVRVGKVSGAIGHAYYYKDSAVSSDLVRLIREDAKAGSERRPLRVDRENFYTLPKNYFGSQQAGEAIPTTHQK